MGLPRGGESLLLLLELEVSSGDVRLCVVEDVLEDRITRAFRRASSRLRLKGHRLRPYSPLPVSDWLCRAGEGAERAARASCAGSGQRERPGGGRHS